MRQLSVNQEDVEFANSLLKQGLISGSKLDRALAVLMVTDEHDAGNGDNAYLTIPKSSITMPKFQDANEHTSPVIRTLPRNWKDAEKMASKKLQSRPLSAEVTTKTNGDAGIVKRKKLYSAAPRRARSPMVKPSVSQLEEVERLRSDKAVTRPKSARSEPSTKPISASSAKSGYIERRYANAKIRRVCEERIERIGRRALLSFADATDVTHLDMAYIRLIFGESRAIPQAAASISPGKLPLSHPGSDFTFEVANYCAPDSAGAYVPVSAPGTSLLHMCATWNLADCAGMLLSAGAIVNRVNELGETPLHWAAASNAYATAVLLLDFGADLTAEDASGSCALMRAAHGGHLELVSLLLARARGSVGAAKLQQVLVIAREAAQNESAGGGDAVAVKQAALLLIQRHLQMQHATVSLGISATNLPISPSPTLQSEPQSLTLWRNEELFVIKDQDDLRPDAAELEAEIARLASQCVELRTLSAAPDAHDSALAYPPQSPPDSKQTSLAIAPVSSSTNRLDDTSIAKSTETVSIPDPPLANVSPQRERVVTKFYPASYVPFLHDPLQDISGTVHTNGLSCMPGDVLIAVEQCAHCENHNFSLWHDAAKYNTIADRCLIALVRALLDRGFRVRLFALKEVPRPQRTGALDVTCSVRVNCNGAGRWLTTTLHSKLDTSSWPSVKRVAARGTAFVQWALEQGGLHALLGVSPTLHTTALEPLQRVLLAGRGTEVDVPPSTQSPAPRSAIQKLQVEGQFMSWLIRLSMSSASSPTGASARNSRKGKQNTDTGPAARPQPTGWDPLLASQPLTTALADWSRSNIQSFGAFYNPLARIGSADRLAQPGIGSSVMAGSGANAVTGRSAKRSAHVSTSAAAETPFGAALDAAAFEQLVLQHFFVFDNTAPLLGSSSVSPTPRSVVPAAAQSVQPTHSIAESFVTNIIAAAIDVAYMYECHEHVEMRVDDARTPALPPQPSTSNDCLPVSNSASEDVKPTAIVVSQGTVFDPPLCVGDRIEGNYCGGDHWYRGIILAVSCTNGDVRYDVEYDDEEQEFDLPVAKVRRVQRRGIAALQAVALPPEPALKEPTELAYENEFHQDEEEESMMIEYQTMAGLPPVSDAAALSPTSPLVAEKDADSLVFSMSISADSP